MSSMGKLSLLFAATSILATMELDAAMVFNNGAPNSTSGNEMTQWIQAEDFTLGSPTTLTDVRFWGFNFAAPTAFQGNVTWQIYGNNAGTPGSLLFSGNASPVVTNQGAIATGGQTQQQLDFSVGSVALAAGTYWLGLHNGPLSTTTRLEYYWQSTGSNASLSGREDNAPFEGTFASNSTEHAFQLFGGGEGGSGVPEPSTIGLFSLGLVSMLAMRRRIAGR